MLIQGQVGPITTTSSLGAGTQAPIRQGNMGEEIFSQLHGKTYEATYRRSVFSASNQAGVTHSAALTQVWIGICAGNPTTSTINMSILMFGWAFVVAPAAPLAVGIMSGVGASIVGAITPRNRYVGGAAGQGLATGGCTLPSVPVLETILGFGSSQLAVASWPPGTANVVDLNGGLILPPGAYVASYCSVASGAAGFFGTFIWEEIPI